MTIRMRIILLRRRRRRRRWPTKLWMQKLLCYPIAQRQREKFVVWLRRPNRIWEKVRCACCCVRWRILAATTTASSVCAAAAYGLSCVCVCAPPSPQFLVVMLLRNKRHLSCSFGPTGLQFAESAAPSAQFALSAGRRQAGHFLLVTKWHPTAVVVCVRRTPTTVMSALFKWPVNATNYSIM